MGLMPRLRAASWNVTAENMLPCSVTASAGIFSSAALVEQFLDAAGAVEQRELGVQVQVDEIVMDEVSLHHHPDVDIPPLNRGRRLTIVDGGFEMS
jgi:hypothetical protein